MFASAGIIARAVCSRTICSPVYTALLASASVIALIVVTYRFHLCIPTAMFASDCVMASMILSYRLDQVCTVLHRNYPLDCHNPPFMEDWFEQRPYLMDKLGSFTMEP